MQVETLDYQSPGGRMTGCPGKRSAACAYGFAVAALVFTLVAAPVHYHSIAFGTRDLIGALAYLASWVCAGLGAILGGIAIGTSHGKRGLWPLTMSVIILAGSIVLMKVLPGYGLGNIH